MAKYKGAKWAQILTLMAAMAASIISGVAEAKAYADGLVTAISAGDISFSSNKFNNATVNVEDALIELADKANADVVSFQVLQTPNTGKLKSYRFTKGTGAGATTMDIDIERDLLNGTFELVTIVEGTGADAGKYFDGATEVGSAQGVTGAGVYMKYNNNAAGEASSYSYADMSSCIEYLTVGNQTGKMVTLAIDPQTHTITADIADGTLTKAKLESSVQTSLGKADTALQEADFEWVTDNEVTTAWAAAMATAAAAASASQEEEQSGGE